MAARQAEDQGGLEGRHGAVCAPPSSDSHVIMWQVQIARTVVHVPIGGAPPPINEAAEDFTPLPPFQIELKPRRDHFKVVTGVAPGGPTDADGALQVGDLLINVNGKAVRGLGAAEVGELLAGPKPLTLTLGAEFRPGSGYAVAHELLSGETLPVARVGQGQARAAGPGEGANAAPERSRDQLGDGLPLTPRSSVRTAIPADPSRLCSHHSYDGLPPSAPHGSFEGSQGSFGGSSGGSPGASQRSLCPAGGMGEEEEEEDEDSVPSAVILGSSAPPSSQRFPTAPGMSPLAGVARSQSAPEASGKPPKPPKSTPRRALSKVRKVGKAMIQAMTPRGPRHDKESGLGNGPYQDAGLSGSPFDMARTTPTAPLSPPGGAVPLGSEEHPDTIALAPLPARVPVSM